MAARPSGAGHGCHRRQGRRLGPSGGIFACGEAEHLREQYAVWVHAMYDANNLYLLARWKDPTPLNNPENKGGHGFNGDCLQVRFILFPDTADRDGDLVGLLARRPRAFRHRTAVRRVRERRTRTIHGNR